MNPSYAPAADRYWSSIWRPGVQGLLVFVALGVIGFLIRHVYPAGIVMDLIGAADRSFVDVYLEFFIEPAIRCVLAFSAGFLFPRGFYLWGIAIAIHTPFSQIFIAGRMREAGLDPYLGDTADFWGYLFLITILTLVLVVVYTCFAGVGMLVQYLAGRSRRTNQIEPE